MTFRTFTEALEIDPTLTLAQYNERRRDQLGFRDRLLSRDFCFLARLDNQTDRWCVKMTNLDGITFLGYGLTISSAYGEMEKQIANEGSWEVQAIYNYLVKKGSKS